MSDLTTTAIEHQFYNELIDKFFHPKSYFFYCIRKYLDNPLLFTDKPNFSITQIISLLFEYLSKSKQPTQDLNEITKIKGFENLVLNLETLLIRFDLKTLDQPQLKKAIQNIASNFLKYIFQVLLENEKVQNTLINYLEIKMKLIELLNGANGKHKNKSKLDDSIKIETANTSKMRLFNLKDENNSAMSSLMDQPSDNFNLLDNYFEKEISRLLKPLAIFSNNTSEFYTNTNFVKQIYENFSQIKDLATYYGYQEIKVIAERVAELVKTLQSKEHSFNQSIIGLIYDAKAKVEKYLLQRQNSDNLKGFLDTFDFFISELNRSDITKENLTIELNTLPIMKSDKAESFELNTSVNKINESSQKSGYNGNKSSIFSGLLIEKNDSKKVERFKFQGEDDEELLKLIHEIPDSSLPEDFFIFHEDEPISNAESQKIPTDKPFTNAESQNIELEKTITNSNSQTIPTKQNFVPENLADNSDNLDAAISTKEQTQNIDSQISASEKNAAQEEKSANNLNNVDAEISTNEEKQNIDSQNSVSEKNVAKEDKSDDNLNNGNAAIETNEEEQNIDSQNPVSEKNVAQEEKSNSNLQNVDTAISTNEEIQNINSQNTVSEENTVQEEKSDDGLNNVDASTNQIFQKEAVLYYKILLNAISQLKNEEKIQAALEDIELAGSSLKYLAQKFGMEKIALLPELVESISIVTNKNFIKLPPSILQGMEDGINLLKGFDVNNKDHIKTFMSILTLLKEFCTKTFDTTQKIQIAS